MLGKPIHLAVVIFNLFLRFLLGRGTFVKSLHLQNYKLLERPSRKNIIHGLSVEKPGYCHINDDRCSGLNGGPSKRCICFLIPGRSEYYLYGNRFDQIEDLNEIIWNYLSESEVAQSCPTFCDHVDCSRPGSSVHGILQAKILQWVASSFSRGSSGPRDQTQVSCIAGRRFNLWATRECSGIIYIGPKYNHKCLVRDRWERRQTHTVKMEV